MYDVFNLPDIAFPAGFLWGSATAAHQVEGDNVHSQRWADEQAGRITVPSGKACDHYRRYRGDVALLARLGHGAYRMSVEWSRIEPENGRWDEAAADHYVDLLERLKNRGIRPFVTLHHVTHPLWFEKLGGFAGRGNLRYFERFLERLVPRLSPFTDGWTVLNEFNLSTAPDSGPLKLAMLRAHARGYHIIKRHSKAPVGTAHAYIHWLPARCHDPLDRVLARYADFLTNEFFFHAVRTGEIVYPHTDAAYDREVKGSMDFWGVNYYHRQMADARRAGLRGTPFRHTQLTLLREGPMAVRELYPEGLIAAIERLGDRPIYITENGLPCEDDRFRIVSIALHLAALREAMDRGADVRGYFHWSLMDNYEWDSFAPRFGLVHVDFRTFQRTPKPSAYFYRDVIRRNGFGAGLLKKYLRELPTVAAWPPGPGRSARP